MIKFDNIPTTSTRAVITLTGTVSASIETIEYGTDLSSMSVVPVNNLRFSVVLELAAGDNDFHFVGKSGSGGFVEGTRRNIPYTVPSQTTLRVQNQLDMHGERFGYERLNGERNPNYRTRLVQGAAISEDGKDHIQKAASTEIAFPYSMGALHVWVERSTYNHPLLTNPYIRVTFDNLEVTAEELRTEEVVNFSWADPYITPSSTLSEVGPIELFLESGEAVPQISYEYDVETARVWIKDINLADQDLTISYQTILAFSLSGDIAALTTSVQADGRLNMEFTDTDNHDTTSASNLIIPRPWELFDSGEQLPDSTGREQPGNRFSLSEVTTYVLHSMRRELLNSEGNGLGTKLQKFVDEINRIDRRTWARVVVGKDGLRDRTLVPLFDSFPHVTDNLRGSWGASAYNIHEFAYLGTSSDEYKGVRPHQWQSGIGSQDDLEPSVVDLNQRNSDTVFDNEKIPANVIYGVL